VHHVVLQLALTIPRS